MDPPIKPYEGIKIIFKTTLKISAITVDVMITLSFLATYNLK